MNTKTRLINRAAVREFTLATLAEKRPHLATKFNRVADEWYVKAEEVLRVKLTFFLENMPTVGETIR